MWNKTCCYLLPIYLDNIWQNPAKIIISICRVLSEMTRSEDWYLQVQDTQIMHNLIQLDSGQSDSLSWIGGTRKKAASPHQDKNTPNLDNIWQTPGKINISNCNPNSSPHSSNLKDFHNARCSFSFVSLIQLVQLVQLQLMRISLIRAWKVISFCTCFSSSNKYHWWKHDREFLPSCSILSISSWLKGPSCPTPANIIDQSMKENFFLYLFLPLQLI